MTVVQDLLTDDSGAPTTGYVTARLIGAGLRPDTHSQVVTASPVRVGVDGQWSRDLVPTGLGEFYRVTVQPDEGTARTMDIQVPESSSTAWLGDLLLTAPVPEGTQLAGYLRGPAGSGASTAAEITDASTVGRAVLTASSPAAARDEIGAADAATIDDLIQRIAALETAAAAPPSTSPETSYLLTEAGDVLTTEAGDVLVFA